MRGAGLTGGRREGSGHKAADRDEAAIVLTRIHLRRKRRVLFSPVPLRRASQRLDEVDKDAQRRGYEPPSRIIEEWPRETLPPSVKNGRSAERDRWP